MFHLIYKELTNACGSKDDELMCYFQILPRLIPVDGAPTWFLDVLVPATHTLPTAHIYHYFTGNAVGSTVILEFGGIHCMLVAGLNIREAPTPLPPITPTNWLPSMMPLLSPSHTFPTC